MFFNEVTSALDPELVGEVLNVVAMFAERPDIIFTNPSHRHTQRFLKAIIEHV